MKSKRWLIGLGLIIWSAGALTAESIWKSFHPYLVIEKSLATRGTSDLRNRPYYEIAVRPMDMAAAGVTFSKSFFSVSASLAAPWGKTQDGSMAAFPGIDLNMALRKHGLYAYGGWFRPFRTSRESSADGRENIAESGAPLYAGIGFSTGIKRVNLDLGFRISSARTAPYAPDTPGEPFQSYAVLAKIGTHAGKGFHPYLSFAAQKASLVDGWALRFAMGIMIAKPTAAGGPSPVFAPPLILRTWTAVVRKPNIYLYPERETRIEVAVAPNGKITASDPPYHDGWWVTARPDGSIDGTPGFLFYEAMVTIAPGREGWCIPRDGAAPFFRKILAEYGFLEREIEDFLEYWVPMLSASPFYMVHPVLKDELEKVCPLNVIPAPDRVLRVWFLFRPIPREVSLPEPKITPFPRSGFVVTEWGGMVR